MSKWIFIPVHGIIPVCDYGTAIAIHYTLFAKVGQVSVLRVDVYNN